MTDKEKELIKEANKQIKIQKREEQQKNEEEMIQNTPQPENNELTEEEKKQVRKTVTLIIFSAIIGIFLNIALITIIHINEIQAYTTTYGRNISYIIQNYYFSAGAIISAISLIIVTFFIFTAIRELNKKEG